MTALKHDQALQLNRMQFRRRSGVDPGTFAEMEAVLHDREASKRKPGRPPALPVGAQLLLTLKFWREYRTFFHIGQAFLVRTAPRRCRSSGAAPPLTRLITPSLHRRVATLARWGMHETTVLRTVVRVEDALLQGGRF